jgi:hypothetical protein
MLHSLAELAFVAILLFSIYAIVITFAEGE